MVPPPIISKKNTVGDNDGRASARDFSIASMSKDTSDKIMSQRIAAAYIGSDKTCPNAGSENPLPGLKVLLDEIVLRVPGKFCRSWNATKARKFLVDHPRSPELLDDVISGAADMNLLEVREVCLGGRMVAMATPDKIIGNPGKRARLSGGDEPDSDDGVSDDDLDEYIAGDTPPVLRYLGSSSRPTPPASTSS